jgi:hypothetical protein
MKTLALLLALAVSGHAAVVGPTTVQLPDVGCKWPLSGSVTYALNNALTGVASTAIDLNGSVGIYLTLTSTGSGIVTVYFSNSNVAGTSAISSYQVTSPGNYCVEAKARYLSFYNASTIPTTRVSAYYYLSTPSINVTASGGASSVTITSNTSSYVSVSTSAYTVLSQTATVLNLTNVAGVSAPCLICLTSNGGAAAGFKVQFGTSATAPGNLTASSVGHYVAASTTSQCWGPFKAGGHAYIAGVAASSSVIFDIHQAQ